MVATAGDSVSGRFALSPLSPRLPRVIRFPRYTCARAASAIPCTPGNACAPLLGAVLVTYLVTDSAFMRSRSGDCRLVRLLSVAGARVSTQAASLHRRADEREEGARRTTPGPPVYRAVGPATRPTRSGSRRSRTSTPGRPGVTVARPAALAISPIVRTLTLNVGGGAVLG
jgi:hypothetical protein